MEILKKNVDRILLVAILIVGLIGVFGGSKSLLGSYDSGKVSVTDSDAAITGDLTVEGDTAVEGALTITGTTTLSGTLSGFATSSLTTLTVSGTSTLGITNISGAFGVTGATTLATTSVGGTLGVTGATTLTGALSANGAATFAGVTKVQASASSTLIVGGAGTGGGYTAGCIKIGDSASATATPVYITATGETITATTTRPATCSSQ